MHIVAPDRGQNIRRSIITGRAARRNIIESTRLSKGIFQSSGFFNLKRLRN